MDSLHQADITFSAPADLATSGQHQWHLEVSSPDASLLHPVDITVRQSGPSGQVDTIRQSPSGQVDTVRRPRQWLDGGRVKSLVTTSSSLLLCPEPPLLPSSRLAVSVWTDSTRPLAVLVTVTVREVWAGWREAEEAGGRPLFTRRSAHLGSGFY